MLLNNEVINAFLRSDKGIRTFASAVQIGSAAEFSANGQCRVRVTLGEALAAIVHSAMQMHPDLVHPSELVGIEVSREALGELTLSLVRVDSPQPDLLVAPVDLAKLVGSEVKDAAGAHGVADKILKTFSEESPPETSDKRRKKKNGGTMDNFVGMLSASPNPALTQALLNDAGPEHTRWIAPSGPLAPLTSVMPACLPASRLIEVKARILGVKDKQEVALLEIDDICNDYSKSMLTNCGAEVELRFDKQSVERDDLVLLQYLKCPVRLRASAVCPTGSKHSKKASLTLQRIMLTRTEMDRLHAEFRQLSLPLETGDGG